VFQTGVGNALTGVDQVVHVVKSVEVTDTGHAVLLEHVSVELDHVAGLRSQCHNVNTAGQGLKTSLGADNATEFVHHVECVFAAVLVEGLETCATTCFKVSDTCVACCFDSGHEVLCEHAGTENRLETITEGGVLEFDLFHVSSYGAFDPVLYSMFYQIRSENKKVLEKKSVIFGREARFRE